MTKISDIAEACGVSTATVSYVLTGKASERRISNETKELVIRTAQEMNYQRSSKVPRKIPVVAIYIQDENFDMTVPPIMEAVKRVQYSTPMPVNIVMRPYGAGHIADERYLFANDIFDAAVITGINAADIDSLTENRPHIPTVLVNRAIDGYPSISIDSEEVGVIASRIALNISRDIAIVMNPHPFTNMTVRSQTFTKNVIAAGVDLEDAVFFCPNKIDCAFNLGMEIVNSGKLKKVYYCNYDMVALGMMNAFSSCGIKVGEDVYVFASSNGPGDLFAYSYPPLTIIDQKFEEINEAAIRLAIDYISKRTSAIRQRIVHPEVIYRKSCPAKAIPFVDPIYNS